MVTYKNIRIPKRGGGTRLQRVQVLASGKYKFVKNVKSGSRKKTKRVKSKSRSIRRSSKSKNRGKSMARRKFTIPVALVGGVVGMPAVQRGVSNLLAGDINGLMRNLSQIVGVDQGKFNPERLKENLVPLAIGVGVHIAARKLGVNRMLGQAGVPILRI